MYEGGGRISAGEFAGEVRDYSDAGGAVAGEVGIGTALCVPPLPLRRSGFARTRQRRSLGAFNEFLLKTKATEILRRALQAADRRPRGRVKRVSAGSKTPQMFSRGQGPHRNERAPLDNPAL